MELKEKISVILEGAVVYEGAKDKSALARFVSENPTLVGENGPGEKPFNNLIRFSENGSRDYRTVYKGLKDFHAFDHYSISLLTQNLYKQIDNLINALEKESATLKTSYMVGPYIIAHKHFKDDKSTIGGFKIKDALLPERMFDLVLRYAIPERKKTEGIENNPHLMALKAIFLPTKT